MTKKPFSAAQKAENSPEKQAQILLDAKKYKEAIGLYKQLLQNSDNSEWRRQLAYCYLQKAKDFSEKEMFQEALVSWDNYRQHAQPPYENYDHFVVWSLQTKNPAKIQSALAPLTAQQLDKEYPELAALLGFLILTDHPELQSALPQDSIFIAHLKIVQTALQAYREHDPELMNEALKQLPYRSAFRDFRTLLRAYTTVSASAAETQSLLNKIPANSPYSQASRLLLACTLKGSALARELQTLTPPQRRLTGKLIGLTREQIDLVEALSKQKQPLSDKIQFNLAIQFKPLFGPELAQRFCFAKLTDYPAGRRAYAKAFGSIDEFEDNRLKALACEREYNDNDAVYYWRQCIKALSKKGAGEDLKIALLLRHIAQNQPEPERISMLIESLAYDPDDRECYLQILNHFSRSPDTDDQYENWLSKAFDQFPQDIEVLTLATQAAARDKAYKKAIQYASKILATDPLNTFAKQVVFSSHLAHARRLLRSKKYPLVEPEIIEAERLKGGKSNTLLTQLMRAFLVFTTEDKTQGLQAIAEALNKLNADPVNAHFQAAIEAILTGLPVATLLRGLPPAKEHKLSPQELTRLTQQITYYSQQDSQPEQLHKALEKIKAPLKQSVSQQQYDEDLLLSLCRTLDSIHHFELLRHCSKHAQSKWRKPIWMYYRIYSTTNGDPDRCTFADAHRLQINLEKARLDKDSRAKILIENYLSRYHETHPPIGMGFFEDLLNMNEQEDSGPLDQLFAHLPDDILDELDDKLESMSKKTSPEQLAEDLSQFTGNNRKLFLAMTQNPDLFTALMLVKAANKLSLDIGVTFEDVLACFDVDKAPRSFPFPF